MKKFDFLRIIFGGVSSLMLILGLTIQDSNRVSSIVGFIAVFALIIFDINADKIFKLSKDNPKVKTIKTVTTLNMGLVILVALSMTLEPVRSVPKRNLDIIIVLVLALYIMIFGNIAPKIPFNRYLGFRLPWTIRDEETWRTAHRLLGYTSFPIGIVMAIASFYFNMEQVVLWAVALWILIPGVYSGYFYYKKMKKFVS
ncbi:MAG: SdpI family protein [Clostridium perfringens]|nr:SdpI family protein [Clostridium perfringens]